MVFVFKRINEAGFKTKKPAEEEAFIKIDMTNASIK